MSKPRGSSRRSVLKSAAASGAGLILPLWWRQSRGQESANDRLTVAAIGTGVYSNRYTGKGDHPGRGMTIALQASTLGDMVAVADVNLAHGRFFNDQIAKRTPGKSVEIFQDYRKLLERKDIDAVTIGTPDHWHVKIAIDAMQAGKHVYCEKPLSLTVDEGRQLLKVAAETKKVIQIGTQQRSEYGRIFLKAIAIARSRVLGKKLHALVSVGTSEAGGPFPDSDPPADLNWDMWLGQAPKVPYCKNRSDFDFRWWSEYAGGQVTDWGVHHMDIALWAMGLENTGPVTIEGKGTFPNIKNGYNVSVDFDCNLTFADGQVCRLYSGSNELILTGENGRIRVNRGGLTGAPVEALTPADNDRINDEIIRLCHGKDPSGENGDDNKAGAHMHNFFDCVKDGGRTISDPATHHRSVSACHLANIAMSLNRKLTFDPQNETFPGDEEATALLKREQRPEYSIYNG
jgi:myo-inositol 2-dehydrogenase/D-chiro-inositol 1-dehydrogenase